MINNSEFKIESWRDHMYGSTEQLISLVHTHSTNMA